MKIRKILSLILCIFMLIPVFPQEISAAADPKMNRRVYLHAQSMPGIDDGVTVYNYPVDKSADMSTIYLDDTANIFLSVDDPNLGAGSDGDGNTLEHKYDLNGYTVKITYDSNYFTYNSSPEPFDYTYPNRYGKDLGESGEADPGAPDDAPEDIGYMTHNEGRGTVPGTTYETVYATVMLGGETFPETAYDDKYWYNLLCLPLDPKRTGYTEVWAELVDNDGYGLELLAKNTSTDVTEQTFNLDVKNEGRHKILIKDKDKPQPPVPSRATGKYWDVPFNITLDCPERTGDVPPCCTMYYYLNGDSSNPIEYQYSSDASLTEKISINTLTTLTCYSVRESDGKRSVNADYTYTVVPPAPYLFDENQTLIPDICVRSDSYDVYAAVGDTYGSIPGNKFIYYTYANLDENAPFDVNNTTNAETKWARLDSADPRITVTGDRIVRLITVGESEKSLISQYSLKIAGTPSSNPVKPPVFAPESAQFTKTSDSVTLYCPDSFYENIVTLDTNTDNYTLYYTTDGRDPIAYGIPADANSDMACIPVTANMEIKAVVKQGDSYSDVITHRYYVVTDRPVQPLAVPISRVADSVTLRFAHMPGDIDIYYAAGSDGQYLTPPDTLSAKYAGETLTLQPGQQLKAVCINKIYGTRSDVSVFTYDTVSGPTWDTPEFNKISGYYTKNDIQLKINQIASSGEYALWYRGSSLTEDFEYTNQEFEVPETTSYRAYNRNRLTGIMENPAFGYYIIEADNMLTGDVVILPPYDSSVICTDDMKGEYLRGIKLYSANKDAEIRYYYSYSLADGTGMPNSNVKEYDQATPIMVHDKFYDITITAWLVNKTDYSEIDGSRDTFHIDFVEVPDAVQSDKTYTIKNDYPTDSRTFIFYTLDKTDPSDSTNTGRRLYDGRTFDISYAHTLKAVYFRACGICDDCRAGNGSRCGAGIYGRVGAHDFYVSRAPASGGGGGGSKVRKYTKDIFGTEHPTHIGYINGYPDGSVKPDGFVTREEIAAILYRVRYKDYDRPFVATGDAFPDVEASRWSANDIEFMTDKAVINGYPDGEFKPSRSLTRAEFAALIRRFTSLKKPIGKNIYPDLEDSHWAYEDIMLLTGAGLIQGYEDGTFRPEREVSRAEVMTVINKILGRCPDENYVRGMDFNPFNDLGREAWHYVTVLEATITHDYYLNTAGNLETKWENWK